MKLIIDAMGGDHAPAVPVAAGAKAAAELGVEIVLVGKEDVIREELKKHTYPAERISIVHAGEVITNEEEPAKAVRVKKDASVVVAGRLLKDGGGDAMISMGSTGALLVTGLLVVGRIKGVHRPALATALPTAKGPKLLLDAGANTNCRDFNLVQFGVMGSMYMQKVLEIASPTVGLISNGEEAEKGDALTKNAHQLLEQTDLNFIGNIEGRDIMLGNADIMVCDGFVGNVVLKTVEGMGSMISGMMKDLFYENLCSKIGGLLVTKGLRKFKKKLDYREYGGAPLLGVKKPVIKGHGSSDAKAAFAAIVQAKKFVETGLIAEIETCVTQTALEE